MQLQNTSVEKIKEIVQSQKEYFHSGATLNVQFRKEMLSKLMGALEAWEERLCEALWLDLHKSREEAILTELSIVNGELKNHLKHFCYWAKRKRVSTPLKLFPSRSYVVKEPLGCSLIVSPWNYPIQLLLNPLVGAISSGCTAVLKPSPYVPNVSSVIEEMVRDTFEERYIAVIQGDRSVNQALFDLRWDLIFFTGSPALARTVMAAAARNLTPVILELGGKSPCIIDRYANIRTAARRVAWGKTLNSGQTCIAPDYILIHQEVKAEFVKAFSEEIKALHGVDVASDRHYGRIVNDKAFKRLIGYLDGATVLCGGGYDETSRYIEPTLIESPGVDSPVMTEEIFGPIFPIITLDDCCNSFKNKVIEFISSREKPLAFYYFGKVSDGWDVVGRTSSGGGCINDTIMHIANENVPFGGVGNSGMGNYHGKLSFDAFSHTRSIIVTPTWLDVPFRYMPYKMFELIKRIL